MITLAPKSQEVMKHGELQTVHFLKISNAERLEFEKVCELIAHRTTLTEYEVEFVLAEVQKVIIENFNIGRGTELGPLGCVEVSLEAESKATSEELDLKTVKRMKLLYKPSIRIKHALKKVQFRIKREY